MKERLLRGLLNLMIILAVWTVPDLILARKVLDNNVISLPAELSYGRIYSKNGDSRDGVLSNQQDIKEILDELSQIKYRRKGFGLLSTPLAYPKFIIIPKYTDRYENDVFAYEIDKKGRVEIFWNGHTYKGKGKIPKDNLKIIERILNDNLD